MKRVTVNFRCKTWRLSKKAMSKNIGALKDQLQIDPNLFSKDITSNDNDCCKHFFEEGNVPPPAVNSRS